MRILSIDLPWSTATGNYGFAWVDLSAPTKAVATDARPSSADAVDRVFSAFAEEQGSFDVVLVDQPVGEGETATGGYRPVERAFANSAFVTNGPHRIQAPRFQPGAAHATKGRATAESAERHFGNGRTVVVESFPQLSILPLLDFSLHRGLRVEAVTGLAAHKRSGRLAKDAARQLVSAFEAWSRIVVTGPAADPAQPQPDALDALLALLPALEVLAPSGPGADLSCWLHSAPPDSPEHPSALRRSRRLSARAPWMSPLENQVGPAGVRADGILSLRLPGWPAPSAPRRPL